MAKEQTEGVPVGGFKTVGQIVGTNEAKFHTSHTGLAIAVELLSTHTSGAPVVNSKGEFKGFISEFDLLSALASNKDLAKIKADEIMNKDRLTVTEDATIEAALNLMKKNRIHNLPVIRDGKVAYTVTRHDLLRAWIGLGIGMGWEGQT